MRFVFICPCFNLLALLILPCGYNTIPIRFHQRLLHLFLASSPPPPLPFTACHANIILGLVFVVFLSNCLVVHEWEGACPYPTSLQIYHLFCFGFLRWLLDLHGDIIVWKGVLEDDGRVSSSFLWLFKVMLDGGVKGW